MYVRLVLVLSFLFSAACSMDLSKFGKQLSEPSLDGGDGALYPLGEKKNYFGGASDMVQGNNGLYYILDVSAQGSVTINNAQGVTIARIGSYGTGNGQFRSPSKIAIDIFNNFYVLDTGNYRVQKFNSDGDYLLQWGVADTGATGGDYEFNVTGGLAIDSAGLVYVTNQSGTFSEVKVYNSIGVYQRRWGTKGSAAGEFSLPLGLAIDAHDRVYVVDCGNNRIQRFDNFGGNQFEWGSLGTGNGQFGNYALFAIAVSPAGDVYTAEQGSPARVQRFDENGAYINDIGVEGFGEGKLTRPVGLSFDSSGKLMVADLLMGLTGWIQRFNVDGSFINTMMSGGTGPGELRLPQVVTVYKDEFSVVGDTGNYRIQKYNIDGLYVSGWGSRGWGHGAFKYIIGINVDSVGNIYVLDYDSTAFAEKCLIQKFSKDGTYITEWDGTDSGQTALKNCYGMTINSQDEIFVADYGNQRIQKFNSTGGYIATIGQASGEFVYPAGLAVDANDDLYAVDLMGKVQKFSGSTNLHLQDLASGSFTLAIGIAISSSGRIYVSDALDNSVQELNASGATVKKWGVSGIKAGQITTPWGLAVGADGSVYVADVNNSRVQKFDADGNVQQ